MKYEEMDEYQKGFTSKQQIIDYFKDNRIVVLVSECFTAVSSWTDRSASATARQQKPTNLKSKL